MPKLHVDKCQSLSISTKNVVGYKYLLGDDSSAAGLMKVMSVTYLRVIFDKKLKVEQHISEKSS